MTLEMAFTALLSIAMGLIAYLAKDSTDKANVRLAALEARIMLVEAEYKAGTYALLTWQATLPDKFASKDEVTRAFDRFEVVLRDLVKDQKDGFQRLSDELKEKQDKT